MECPGCRIEITPRLKACGSIADYLCNRCGFFQRENTGFMDFGQVHDWAAREAQFRRLVRKAMINGGLHDLDQQTDFLLWLIGPDFQQLPYMVINKADVARETKKEPEDWISRIRDRGRLRGIHGGTKVYDALTAAVENYRGQRLFIGQN